MGTNKKRLGKFSIVPSVDDTYYEPLIVPGSANKRILPSNSAKSKSVWLDIGGGIIAYAGGGQSNATQLTRKTNIIETCTSRNDSVKLPSAVNGLEIYILNLGSEASAIYPSSGDNFVGYGDNIPMYINPYGIVRVICETDGEWLDHTENANFRALNSITAYAGGGQANATQLIRQYNRITTCATNGDSVRLKAALNNEAQTVRNDTNKYIDCFPKSGDSIGNRSTNGSIRIYPGQEVNFICYTAGVWIETVIGDSVESGMTAYAGGGQANATQLYAMANIFSTVGTAGDSAKLPSATVGMYFEVLNEGANAMDLYPATSNNFKGSGANVATSIAASNSLKVRCYTQSEWTIV